MARTPDSHVRLWTCRPKLRSGRILRVNYCGGYTSTKQTHFEFAAGAAGGTSSPLAHGKAYYDAAVVATRFVLGECV